MSTEDRRLTRLLNQVNDAWTEFLASYFGLSDEQLLIPGVTGDWSIRDLIAHVTWWEEEALTHLPVILDGGRVPRYSTTYGGIDAFNAIMTERKQDLSLDDVRREFVETHERLVDYLRSVPPEQMFAGQRFRRRLRLDAYGHYPIHAAEIRAWRQRQGL